MYKDQITAPSQGAKANKSGKILENIVRTALLPRGFTEIPFRAWERLPQIMKKKKYLIHNAPYDSVYAAATPAGQQNHSRSEFIISDPQTKTFCRIECKWQAVSGSVDEKLPYLYLNAVERWLEEEIIILIDGKGWKRGALFWLREAVNSRRWRKSTDRRAIMMMNIAEFTTWCQQRFP